MSIYVGLDCSLTGTGVAILDEDTPVLLDIIKTTPEKFKDEMSRMIYIRDMILSKIPPNVELIGIEDTFVPFNSRGIGAALSLSRLAGIIRAGLYEAGFKYLVIQPTSLKKFVLGKGVGEKDTLMLEVLSRWGIKIAENNISDAFCMAKFVQAVKDTSKLTIPQRDAIDKVMEAGIWQKDDNWAPEKKVRAKKSKEIKDE